MRVSLLVAVVLLLAFAAQVADLDFIHFR